jgi:Tannase and feruloyl esterase
VKTAVGGQSTIDKFVRYYQAPGVDHCLGGADADSINPVTVLDKWVAQGTDPGQPTASKLNSEASTAFTRPLCQYPKYPRYNRAAIDVNAAKLTGNYSCTTP